jgi:lipopolysaccharide export LptBFGC system permease protein LptF
MRLYRGCVFVFFGLVVALVSVALSRAFGLAGLLLPPALVGFTYIWVDSFLAELIRWDEDRNRD